MLRTYLVAMALGACTALTGCVDDDYTFNGTDSPDTSVGTDTSTDGVVADVPSTDSGCKGDLDCTFEAPLCDLTTGKCVACLSNDRCKDKQICKEGTCTDVACTTDVHCSSGATGDAGVDADNPDAAVVALKCNPVTNLCEGCKSDEACPLGFLCSTSDGVCRPGCSESHGCVAGRECCGTPKACIDTAKEVTNCGGCGVMCPTPANTTMKCERDTTSGKGACKVASCAAGWADCNGDAADGCETDIFTKMDNCGGCGTMCTIANGTGVCEMGVCKVATCTTGFGNCDSLSTNGCEQSLTTVTHCGACGTACSPTNAAGDCSTGTCKVGTCNTGFGNCDTLDGNGCEINLQNNTDHCNACNNKCPTTSGAPKCTAGVCGFSSCSPGLGDCDGTGTCSTNVTNNVSHCGACGRACTVANGTPQCVGTACSIASCTSGFADCNTSYIDGCETKLDTLTNCGGCGTSCSRTNATATCAGTGGCRINTCNANFGNCDGNDSNGCEKSLAADIANCGLCGKTCTVANGTAGCSGGSCTLTACNAGFANCDTNLADCERAFGTASNTCATAQALNDATASPTFCATKTTESGTATITSSRFFKVHLERCDGGPCKSSDPSRARITLTNPTGLAYDLIVYNSLACGTPISSTVGTAGGTHTYNFVDTGCTDPRDLVIEVRYRSGSSCTAATLSVTSAYFPYP